MNKGIFFIPLLWIGLLSACNDTPYQSGERLYKANCANCHMDNGEGLGALIPPLANSDYLSRYRDQLPCLIRYGLADSILVNGKPYVEKMAGLPNLSEVAIVNILNYINNAWGNKNGVFRLDEVKARLDACPK